MAWSLIPARIALPLHDRWKGHSFSNPRRGDIGINLANRERDVAVDGINLATPAPDGT